MAKKKSRGRNRYRKRATGWAERLRDWGATIVAALLGLVAFLGGILPHLAAWFADTSAVILVIVAGGLVSVAEWMRRESNSPGEKLIWLGAIVALLGGWLAYMGVL